jgi:predicted metal-dependent peptidase
MDAKRKASVEQLCDVIESMPTLKASEWYFNELMDKLGPPPEGDSGDDVLDTLDDHSAWKDVPDDMKEFLEGKIKSLVEKAVRFADSHADGWGNIPAELRAEIRRSVSSIVDWRAVLRQFVGSIQRGSRSTSIKRINRRYPYVHPGVKRGYCAKLIVPIDQSGSVGDEMLEMFFGELGCLTKKVSISVLHFDCECNEGDLYEWRKGMKLPPKRTRMGGTDFDAPTRFVNDPKNRGRWDGMLVMTDGGAGRPQPSRIKRGWVLGKGCSLPWETNELQIKLSDERQMKGAWR